MLGIDRLINYSDIDEPLKEKIRDIERDINVISVSSQSSFKNPGSLKFESKGVEMDIKFTLHPNSTSNLYQAHLVVDLAKALYMNDTLYMNKAISRDTYRNNVKSYCNRASSLLSKA